MTNLEYTLEESNAVSLLSDLDKSHFIDSDSFRSVNIATNEVSFEWLCDDIFVKFNADCKNGHPWRYSFQQYVDGKKVADVENVRCGYATLAKIIDLTKYFARYDITVMGDGYDYIVNASGYYVTDIPHLTVFDENRKVVCVVALKEEMPNAMEDFEVIEGTLPSDFLEWAHSIDPRFTLKKWELANIVYDISVRNKDPKDTTFE